jgi:hypothetical protein
VEEPLQPAAQGAEKQQTVKEVLQDSMGAEAESSSVQVSAEVLLQLILS